MKIDRISYKKIFPLGSYINETMGMEAQLDEGDDAGECLLELKKRVEELHKSSNPGLHIEMIADAIPTIQVEKPKSTEDFIISDIQTCKELKVLESYRLMAKANEKIQKAYTQKEKELTNA